MTGKLCKRNRHRHGSYISNTPIAPESATWLCIFSYSSRTAFDCSLQLSSVGSEHCPT